MKRKITAIAAILGWASAAWAAQPAPLTALRAIHALTNAEAAHGLPVVFEATVTYLKKVRHIFFVQDDGAGTYVFPPADIPDTLVPGDRVLVRGKTAPSFHPIVMGESVTLLRHGAPPKPVQATFDELIRNRYDALLVTVRGVVRSADQAEVFSGADFGSLWVLTEGGYIWVSADRFTPEKREALLDAEVEITGVEGGQFDGKMQNHGVHLHVFSPEYVKVLQRAVANPWSLPITPMDEVITSYHVTDRTQRVRVHGTITYYQPGSSAVLQDGARSLWISTQTLDPLLVGDVVDATGFPESHNGFLALAHGEIRDSHVQAPIAPLPTNSKELITSSHIIDLVSIEARVMSAARGATQDEYGLIADGQLFTAIYHHPPVGLQLPPMKQIPLGSTVRVSGICINEDPIPFSEQVAFDILMRSSDDIEAVGNPSPINTRNLTVLVGLLLVVILAVVARGWLIERKVRRQTSAMATRVESEAALERRRSGILEAINGTEPLAGILEQIVEVVSLHLGGVGCWCEVTDGARLGKRPSDIEKLRVISCEIPSRSGPSLGTLFAAFQPNTHSAVSEAEALATGVRLAALAIETRRLYSDLLHRSEFDLLTDIHNRFSLENQIDTLIEKARGKAGMFGVIYVDLDKFKQVNDIYGHHVGDLYLQEAARRMKQQLRSHDLLARLGGDEFAVLLPMVRNRAGVEEIAQRLEHCFDSPLVLEGNTLQGSASFGIALYPEDSATTDGILNAADAAMYTVKNSKRQVEVNLI
ncbi:MAG: GGDEF domain-containing protein [Terracidiphilus sp.]|jgi:diguanylate cyclase (GGDEF)-like protein